MAIDSRSKRASVVSFIAAHVLAPPLPDGTISQPDRQHIAWTYSGIEAETPAVATGAPYQLPMIGVGW